jgi:hypothetical protein
MIINDCQCANQQQQHDHVIGGDVAELVVDQVPGDTGHGNTIEAGLNGVTDTASFWSKERLLLGSKTISDLINVSVASAFHQTASLETSCKASEAGAWRPKPLISL